MARQPKASGKHPATKRVRKTGGQSRRATADAPPQRSAQARHTRAARGTDDTVRKPASEQQRAARPRAKSRAGVAAASMVQRDRGSQRKNADSLLVTRENPADPRRTTAAVVRMYTWRTRTALSAAWQGVLPGILAQARALRASGRRLFGQLKDMSLHVTQPSAKKQRVGRALKPAKLSA